MLRQLKKGLLLGVGLADLTREAAQKRIKTLVKDNHITSKEGKVLLKTMVTKAKREQVRLAKKIDAETKRKVRALVTRFRQTEKEVVQEGRAEALKTLEKVAKDLQKRSATFSRYARGNQRKNKNIKRKARKSPKKK
ncbi:hypothetical protein HYW21_09285 [Candidatus Woesearchaeota archaeon]|nr:hypothetical protein [Candidatus Woesearchaeota archaeon]